MKQTDTPLYQQIKNGIIDRIKSGELTAGMKIESESAMVASTGASRMTVNRALRELTDEGFLRRVTGSGSFVAYRKPQSALLEIKSIAEEIKARGGVHSSVTHLIQEEKARPSIASEMGLEPYAPVFHSVIIHKDNGVPIQLSYRYINPMIAPHFLEQDFDNQSISEYLLSVSPVTAMEHTVEALIPDAWIRDLLEINSSEPCLALHRKTWSGENVATFSTFYYPGSRYSLFGRYVISPSNTINVI